MKYAVTWPRLVFFFLLGLSVLQAQKSGKLAQVGMAFLDIPVGSRAAGMGDAYVSAGDDANAVFWNPAGIALVSNWQLMVNYTPWLADITHNALAFSANLGNLGVIGVSYVGMDYGTITGTRVADTEIGYEVIGNIEPAEFAVGIAYARQVTTKFAYGLHLKYAYQNLGKSKTGYTEEEVRDVENKLGEPAFDFGTLYFTGFKDLRIAMSARNFSREVGHRKEIFPMPLTFSLGIAMDVLTLLREGGDHSLTATMTALHPRDYPERFNLGFEYWFRRMVAARFGYKFISDEESFTLGLGLRLKMGPTGLMIDYSYNHHQYWDAVQKISVGFSFR